LKTSKLKAKINKNQHEVNEMDDVLFSWVVG